MPEKSPIPLRRVQLPLPDPTSLVFETYRILFQMLADRRSSPHLTRSDTLHGLVALRLHKILLKDAFLLPKEHFYTFEKDLVMR